MRVHIGVCAGVLCVCECIMRVRASMRGEIPMNEWVVRGGLAGIKGVVKYSLNTH